LITVHYRNRCFAGRVGIWLVLPWWQKKVVLQVRFNHLKGE
jgi:hypothetical protein